MLTAVHWWRKAKMGTMYSLQGISRQQRSQSRRFFTNFLCNFKIKCGKYCKCCLQYYVWYSMLSKDVVSSDPPIYLYRCKPRPKSKWFPFILCQLNNEWGILVFPKIDYSQWMILFKIDFRTYAAVKFKKIDRINHFQLFQDRKPMLSSSFFLRERFKEYCCESAMSLF